MDHQLSYGFGLMAVGASILCSLVLFHALGAKDTRAKLPPGPWNLPIVGSLHHLVGTLPHRALLRLSRRYGQVMLLRLGEVPTVVISTPEAAMEVLKTKDLVFANRPGGPTRDLISCGGKGLVVTPYGEYWRQMRKVCIVEVLSAKQVRRMDSIQQDEIAQLVDSIAAASSASPAAVVNLGQGMSKLTNNIITRAVFGGKCQQQDTFLRELEKMLVLLGGFSLVDLFPASRLVRWLSGAARDLRRSHARVQEILGDIIVERQEMKQGKDKEDLLDVLLRLQKEDTLRFPLTSEIIGAVIFDLFAAATDTTAATIEWAMAELIRNPEVMTRAKLQVRQSTLAPARGQCTITSADLGGNLHYLRMVIKETLRLHPPVALIRRATQDKCKLMGYDIPKDMPVMINAFAVGRDPRYWGHDAAEFRPERFDAMSVEYSPGLEMEFIPFGFGRRQCPGALMATTTIELVLANLLYHFDWVIPGGASPETLDMGEEFGLIVHCRSKLSLMAATRHQQLH
ncbi:desmethyl-deoxy-podophyllotoxin synthase-like [Hordeum vulgare subsp. vulgare]|uniref:desmethyl-deoxy-podophyllotoxin synthase-like n=1 Tax=Hordeum vulgare subsp. vulgare TaxID=112509 RepID=UPI000296A05D|nr:desmethyl-deoxy-podophyllotoxin synthase-like [Hordeum vulgare subsp. vulgare]